MQLLIEPEGVFSLHAFYVVLKLMSLYTSHILCTIVNIQVLLIWEQPSLILRRPEYEAKSKPAGLTPSIPPHTPPNLPYKKKGEGEVGECLFRVRLLQNITPSSHKEGWCKNLLR